MWSDGIGDFSPELIGREPELRIRLVDSDARLQTRRGSEVVHHVMGIQIELIRDPQIRRIVRVEITSDDSDNKVGSVVQLDGPADDVGVAAEALFPQAIAEHHHISTMRTVFFRREGASRNYWRVEEREVVARNVDPLHLHRVIPAGKIQPGSTRVIACHLAKHTGLLAPEVELRHAGTIERTLRRKYDKSHERLRITIRQRLEQDGIHNREDRRIHADPKRYDKKSNDCESGSLPERAPGVA